MKNKSSGKTTLAVLLHILAWGFILVIPYYFASTFGDRNFRIINPLYVNLVIMGLLFYLNYFIVVPEFLFKGKKAEYFIIALILIAITCTGMWYLNNLLFFSSDHEKEIAAAIEEVNKNKEVLKPPVKQFHIIGYIYNSVLIVGFSLGLKLIGRWTKNERERKELEKAKLNSELAFLKNQISPHFFFNTLNNIYSLINENKETAQDSVLKLSKLMRYLLYESDKDESLLSQEISFLENYINLMKLRVNDKVKLKVTMPESYPDHHIPPLLFVPFVENAFKHGISYREESFIDISLHVMQDQISFTTLNSMQKTTKPDGEKYSGIGLENVRKRLEFLMPGAYQLEISSDDKVFSVDLILKIKPNE